MGKPAFLNKRVGSNAWYYRRRYPAAVASRLGRAEFVQSLQTGSYAEALKRLPAAEAAYLEEIMKPDAEAISGIRPTAFRPTRNLDPALTELTTDAAASLAVRHFQFGLLELDREAISSVKSPNWKRQIEEVEHDLAAFADADDPNTCRRAEAAEIALLSGQRLRAEPSSEASQLLRQYLVRSMLQLARLKCARLHGDYRDEISDRLFLSNPATQAHSAEASKTKAVTLQKLIELFEEEHLSEDDVSAKTARKTKAALALIGRHFGLSRDVSSIDRDSCFAFRDLLAKLPPNFTKRHGPAASLKRIGEANASANGEALNKQTQDHYLRTLRRLLELAKDRHITRENVASGIKPKGKAVLKEAARNSYSRPQLQRIFRAPLYTGCEDDERGFATPGPNVVRRSRFWLPLVALFTGMRLEEILQLTADHVRADEKGDPFLIVSPDMRVKTKNSYRQVPLHRELVKIGFMGLVTEAQDRPGKELFADVPPGLDGYRSSVFSKRYATFLRSLRLEETERKVTFHSFRHTFRDQLRRPEANPDLVRELCGHSRGREVSTSYGDGTPAHVLRPMVDAIDYGVDLSHLYPKA